MPTDRFLIAPFDQSSGLKTNMRPWHISLMLHGPKPKPLCLSWP